MTSFQDAFISYGRADSKAFATYLHSRLIEQGLKIWFDQNDIPLGVDFQNQIDDGIEKSDNFLFIIAPHSINSPYCRKEIELAIRCNKRIIPVLHVEEITQETWQKRNPQRPASEWEPYKAKGLHSSYPNMHPAIGKINWVYLREGIDDFEKSFAGLLEIFARHKKYVQDHTYLLDKALEWNRNQKQSSYLLIGEKRVEAENWLKIKFKDEQPPCEPTNIHCDFICESIKNANNLMTQVFLSYSEKERDFMEKIAATLRREAFTVWTNKTDIKTGADFVEAIYRGIEEADNLVYLMSLASLRSEYCQQEISHALSLNKRIIPILVEELDIEKVPPELRNLQFINFADHLEADKYRTDAAKLINVLRQDAIYYEQHKILLAKALKWERQKHNPSILLRGYNLRNAEAWLKVAKQRTQHLPIPLQAEFIAESLKQPPNAAIDVFISYSRADSEFTRKLNDTLQIQNKTTWFDQESIASGSDFQQEIYRGIETSNNFLFIISPNSINSPYCADEVEYAMQLNKRIVTVLCREVEPSKLHPGLAKVQWIDFRKHGGDFLTNFGELTRTLDTDPEYLRSHTRLLLKAKEWEQHGRDDAFLLRGKDLAASVTWLNESQTKEPHPTPLQLEYLDASRALPHRKIKARTVLLTSLAVTMLMFIGRHFAVTEPLELAAYDQLMRSRPDETQDQRFLMVDVDPESIDKLNEIPKYQGGQGSIADPALDDLFKTLSEAKPRVIGLDFIRNFPAKGNLAQRLRQTQNLIAICKHSYHDNERDVLIPGYKQPPELPLKQVGFNDLVDEDINGGRYVRRSLLMQKPDPDYCNSRESFNLVIARRYLEAENQQYLSPLDLKTKRYVRNMQFGKTQIPRLVGNGGGYQIADARLAGYQTMLKYRTHKGDPNKFAPRVSILDVMNNKVPAEQIRNRIVLIGITDRGARQSDYWNTPQGDMPGITLHGQMISQILSAVLDNRPLIWWWSVEYEMLWIFGWSLVGGIVFWRSPKTLYLVVGAIASLGCLYTAGYLILVFQSAWVPIIQPAIALIVTGAGVVYLTYQLRKV
ncbi:MULTISPECIES: TIR domain-containing protein [Calothrix]|uniref:TIR domain-containing protein n=2 Tax=Calothrix TaxID=1186 RepID=A0ABR8AJZ0_9CYAN|nr:MULTISPECIES: TIR domain-containing protein [Calothrix]MBD2200367.1 TIR domain-containing protein [Calothrix parietina FACHB-288]MBD2229348.1 TIR domain-containing protein [Calothrix anomala FACHB-343]